MNILDKDRLSGLTMIQLQQIADYSLFYFNALEKGVVFSDPFLSLLFYSSDCSVGELKERLQLITELIMTERHRRLFVSAC